MPASSLLLREVAAALKDQAVNGHTMIKADGKKLQAARNAKEVSPGKTLTQEGLVSMLQAEGVDIAERTLQKYEATGKVPRSVLQTIADVLDVPFDSLLAADQAPWWIPQPEWDKARNSPGMLLQAEMAIVPFQFRKQDLAALQAWCVDRSPLRIRLVHGKGGMGKTRLALQFCRHMRDDKGWRAGFLNYDLFQRNNEQWDPLLDQNEPLLLVFDYAESRVEEIAWLLARISSAPPFNIRILLLARHVGDWWKVLKSHRVCGDLLASAALDVDALRPAIPETDRSQSYNDAGRAFSAKLGKHWPGTMPEDIQSSLYDQVLLLHIRALACLEGEKPAGEKAILDYLLSRERRFWREQLEVRRLDATLHAAVEEAMVSITANGGKKTPQDGMELLNVLPSLKGRPADVLIALNNLMSDCYPGDQWIEPVRPDLFGEHLFGGGLTSNPALKGAVFAEVRKAARDRKGRV
ncbi:MAG: helix-turn-helix transcriptional regulator [Opitutaceae bacterium]|nr:helix-turn-helix transcriptional regulator [Opitutaceae bacterium]